MSAETVSRWSRRFVLTGALFFVAWALAALLGLGRRVEVFLALYGFVLHTVFGKGYALIPSYFDRNLAVPRAPQAQFPLSVAAVLALATGALPGGPRWATVVGAILWAAGVAVFLAALVWTVRDNPTGAETGTGDHQAARRPVDRYANAFVPAVLAYLLLGSYELLAGTLGTPTLLDGSQARVTHLLAAGVAALLVFAVGFRLFPRFLAAHPPRPLVWAVLPAGALGPALIAAGLYDGVLLVAGAALQAVAVVGFVLAILVTYRRSERTRTSLRIAVAGALFGVLVVALGLQFALAGRASSLVTLHYRLALAGFLGLVVVGAATQFYPPAVGGWPGASDATAAVAAAMLGGGLLVQLAGAALLPTAFSPLAVTVASAVLVGGEVAALLGTCGYAYLVAAAVSTR